MFHDAHDTDSAPKTPGWEGTPMDRYQYLSQRAFLVRMEFDYFTSVAAHHDAINQHENAKFNLDDARNRLQAMRDIHKEMEDVAEEIKDMMKQASQAQQGRVIHPGSRYKG
jgi:hypothetical protein